ncbi:hypothetical protein AB0M79_16430 [Polymorphospora sp. NPDC051019]|uniref:hypothetical protein n=1 Tax=Polymorphospora sp. NPDC051019 TaxID=3155725 RepID=UPI003432EE89
MAIALSDLFRTGVADAWSHTYRAGSVGVVAATGPPWAPGPAGPRGGFDPAAITPRRW